MGLTQLEALSHTRYRVFVTVWCGYLLLPREIIRVNMYLYIFLHTYIYIYIYIYVYSTCRGEKPWLINVFLFNGASCIPKFNPLAQHSLKLALYLYPRRGGVRTFLGNPLDYRERPCRLLLERRVPSSLGGVLPWDTLRVQGT